MEQSRQQRPTSDTTSRTAENQSLTTLDGAASKLTAESSGNLKVYLRKKQEVARALRSLQEFLKVRGSERGRTECHDLMVKLAEDRFTLAVVGQFNRGKSSLMNAVIGRNLVPTGLLPLTSAVTILRFGPRERLLIPHEGWAFDEEAPVSALSDYVTERGNPGNRRRIKMVHVEVPSPFLRRGLEFVDTPGIGSAIQENTATTYGFLPQCDAVLFVTGVDTPLSEAETGFLHDLRKHVQKVFFVINKVDLVSERERADIVGFVSTALQREAVGNDARIFPISASAALSAKLNDDRAALIASGVPAFEESLEAFLSERRTTIFLTAILDRAMRLLKIECSEMNLRAQFRALECREREDRLTRLTERLAEVRTSYAAHLKMTRASATRREMEYLSKHLELLFRQTAQAAKAEVDDWISGARWELTGTLARGCAASVRSHCDRNLSIWIKDRTNAIERQLTELSERERRNLIDHARRMAKAAAAIFQLKQSDLADTFMASAGSTERLIGEPTISLPFWRPRPPMLLRVLPVRLCRTQFRRQLCKDVEHWLEAVRTSVLNLFQKSFDDAMNRLITSLTCEMEAAESNRLHAHTTSETTAPSVTNLDAEQNERRFRLERRLDALREHVINDCSITKRSEDRASLSSASAAIEKKRRPLTTADIIQASLAKRTCPVCDHVKHGLFLFFSDMQYTLATDEQAQQLHAEALGFCPLHTWHLFAVASPRGLSIAYPKLAERLAAELTALADSRSTSGRDVERLRASSQSCRACRFLSDLEREYLQQLARHFSDRRFRQAYSRSHGVCLHHLAMLVDATSAAECAQYLLTEAARCFTELNDDMQSFAIKRDAIRGALLNEDENDAYRRTLVHLTGDRYLATAQPSKIEF